MVRVLVAGALGRTARLIVNGINGQSDMKLTCCIERYDHPEVGNLLFGGVKVFGSDQIREAIIETRPDVIIDFTTPVASLDMVQIAVNQGVRFVVGTTGYSSDQEELLKSCIVGNKTSAVVSANYSITGNLLFYIGELVARILKGKSYDFEIVEIHDRIKQDSPSGTALELGTRVAKAMGHDLDSIARFGRPRQSTSEGRKREEICFHSLRAGGPGAYIAENSLIIAGPWDRLEVIDRLYGMEGIVEGCLEAVRFVATQAEPGRIYDMLDVLGLNMSSLG